MAAKRAKKREQVSTHSRPKAAGAACRKSRPQKKFQLTAARRRLVSGSATDNLLKWFQLTAARRRLVDGRLIAVVLISVSTHSRPKAAGRNRPSSPPWHNRFNSQPPEGGWHFRPT